MRGAGGVLAVSAQGRWFVSPHAVRAFVTRVLGWRGGEGDALPEALYQRALGEIVEESERAHLVKRYPIKEGHVEADLWRGPKPRRLRYVVAVEVAGGQTLHTLITVLPTTDARAGLPVRAGR